MSGYQKWRKLPGERRNDWFNLLDKLLLPFMVGLLAVCVILFILLTTPKAHAASWDYQWISQTGYGTDNISQPKAVTLELKNTGTQTWQQAQVHLGTSRPNDRHSGFKDASWLADNRIAMQEVSVPPGQNAHFNFTVTPGSTVDNWGGLYNEYFNLVAEGITWFPDIGIYWGWTVPAPTATLLFDWYGPGCAGWTVACGDQTTNVKDTPTGGIYDSADVTTVDRQLTEIRDTGINIVYIDWWSYIGPSGRDTVHSQQAARVIASEIMTKFPTLKFTFMVEPSWGGPHPEGITSDIYNDFYANYAGSPQFLRFNGRPMLVTFYWRVDGGDSRFNVLTYSTGRGYADYWAWPNTNKGGFMPLMHRFDNTPQCATYGTCYYLDGNYTGNVWASQTANALNQRNGVKILFFPSYNEYFERQNWENHLNPDSTVPQTFEQDQIKTFLTQWRS